MDLIKFMSFCTAKKTILKNKNLKKKTMEWEKIFVNDEMNKGLISKILKQFIQLDNIKKQTTQ